MNAYAIVFTLACGLAIVAGLGCYVVFLWAEHRQRAYRDRLADNAMHAHNGRPCYGDCLDRQERAA
jgi:hypothetical protein